MSLEPLPDLLDCFDSDTLVYKSDTEFYYGSDFNKDVLNDIQNHEFQVYGGYYIYRTGWKSPTIYLIGRGKTAGKSIFKVQNFKPYCYVSDSNGGYKTYLGDSCKKIIFEKHPATVKFFREFRKKKGYPLPYEADILFVRRFLCDVYDYFKPTEAVSPKVAIVDIETNHPVSEDIISYCINDQETDLLYDSKFNSNCLVMALDLFEQLKKYDWMTGWNIEFDKKILNNQLIYIFNVLVGIMGCNHSYNKEELVQTYKYDTFYKDKIDSLVDSLLEYEYLKIDDKGKLYLNKELDPVIEHHISLIDLLSISKKMYGQEIRGNWTLGNVGYRLCGINKFDTGSKHIRDLSEEDLFEYNTLDTIIPEIVDNILGGLEAHLTLAWSIQCLLEDVKEAAIINDIALLRAYHKAGLVLPSRDYSKDDKDGEPRYKAAEPDAKPGIYRGIIATDLSHAYPWAVISKNISPETKDLIGENVTPTGVRFNNNKSVFIDTLKEIMAERAKAKKLMKESPKGSSQWRKYKYIDFALKTQAAAFSHGIFGWSISRMVDFEVADAITAVVRDLLNNIKETCDIVGREWIYCHTDSVYINAPKEEVNTLLEHLNKRIIQHCQGYLVMPNLDFKNFYKIGYIHSKARNVLVPEDGNLYEVDTWDVTGMDFLRSETPEPIGDMEIKLISLKFEGHTKQELIEELRKMICNLINTDSTLLGTSKPLHKSILSYGKPKKDGTIGGIPYHISALKRAEKEYGFQVNIGDKFLVLPVITGETEGKRKIKRKRVFIAYSSEEGIPKQYSIDFESYLRSNLWGKISTLFDLKPKELENEVINDDVKACLFAETI